MTAVKELLRELELGSSVAEFDNQLENYFVETQPFRELVSGRKDIVAGDKGTGKTAIFRILHKRYPQIAAIRNVVVIPAFNPSGSPIFQRLTDHGPLEEGEYNAFWKAFILALVGNWVLKYNSSSRHASLRQLDQLLKGLDLRSENDAPQPVFSKIIDKIGHLFRWKSAEMGFQSNVDGSFTFTPKVEFGGEERQRTNDVSVETALRLLDRCLSDVKKTAWVAIDRLDEAFQGYPDIEIPALRALFRSYLDLTEFEHIRLKLFVRRDLFSRIVAGGFVNLTHVNAMKIDVIWDEDDLLSLLCRRIRQNSDFMSRLKVRSSNDRALFGSIFPEQVDQGTRRPLTWDWMMSRIRDGNGIKPPRNLIDLVSMAKDAQLRREDREPRQYEPGKPVIEAESLRRALGQLSDTRVNDTLLAEARNQAPMVERFRRGKAEHNDESLAKLLGVEVQGVRTAVRPLIELGLLEEIGGTFKVPMLYRGGLEITQGKAFETAEPDNEE
jgi:hypothetical protein